mmetsp:Transcript_123123/g.218053  ORF Transcript_123123/g.218053 Transcript_123123/m.218053 type:complete len:285 (+) Transcript_123123:212-1066(+)
MAARLSAGELSKVLNLDGQLYATLDFTAHDSNAFGDQQTFLEPPLGWQIAPHMSDIVENVIAKYPWGTKYLHLSDGAGYGTSKSDTPGKLVKTHNFATEGRKVKLLDLSGYNRILMTSSWMVSPSGSTSIGWHLWNSQDFADCVVACGTEELKCHRAVLSLSPVFKTMFESDMREGREQQVQISDFDPGIVKALVKFIYIGSVPLKTDELPSMMMIADQYGLEELSSWCALALAQQASKETVADVARQLKPFADKDKFQPAFAQLRNILKNNDDMLDALIKSVG